MISCQKGSDSKYLEHLVYLSKVFSTFSETFDTISKAPPATGLFDMLNITASS